MGLQCVKTETTKQWKTDQITSWPWILNKSFRRWRSKICSPLLPQLKFDILSTILTIEKHHPMDFFPSLLCLHGTIPSLKSLGLLLSKSPGNFLYMFFSCTDDQKPLLSFQNSSGTLAAWLITYKPFKKKQTEMLFKEGGGRWLNTISLKGRVWTRGRGAFLTKNCFLDKWGITE